MGRRALLRFRARVDRYKFAQKQQTIETVIAEPASPMPCAHTRAKPVRPRQKPGSASAGTSTRSCPSSTCSRTTAWATPWPTRCCACSGRRRCSPRTWGSLAASQGRHRRLPHQPSLQRRLPARGLGARRQRLDFVRGRRVGTRIPARVSLQAIRFILHSPRLPRDAVPHRARAVCRTHHATRRHPGHLSRGRAHARRTAACRQGRVARLPHRCRSHPGFRSRLHLVPVALNYDRVLEDRTLLRELRMREAREAGDARRADRWQQFSDITRYAGWNLLRLATGRWRRYGRAAGSLVIRCRSTSGSARRTRAPAAICSHCRGSSDWDACRHCAMTCSSASGQSSPSHPFRWLAPRFRVSMATSSHDSSCCIACPRCGRAYGTQRTRTSQ